MELPRRHRPEASGTVDAQGLAAVAEAVEQLAARAPEGAVALLSQEDPRGVAADLLPRIASGIGNTFTDRSQRALLEADPAVLGRLLGPRWVSDRAYCR
jgi:hypothetical protein